MTEPDNPQDVNGRVVSVCTYLPLPYDGHGPARSCATILENMPSKGLFRRSCSFRGPQVETAGHVAVKHTLPLLLRRSPYLAARAIGRLTVNPALAKALESVDPAA